MSSREVSVTVGLPGEEAAASEDSGDDNENLGLMSEEDGQKKARKYDTKKFSTLPALLCCCPGRRACLSVLVGATVVLLLVLIILVVVIVAVLVTNSKNNGEGTKDSWITTVDLEADLESQGIPWEDIRLPSTVSPETYNIHLTVDFENFQVTGSVSISCNVIDWVDFITLHAAAMTINSHTVQASNGQTVDHNGIFYPENDFFIFNLTEPLSPGQILVTLQFNYTLGDDFAGFYRSLYKDADGKKRYLAATQFEATSARKAFPCFDEPAFKATFTISITHHSYYRAWSNMPVLSRTNSGGEKITTSFMTSKRMSTYLVAFIVSDFRCIEDRMTSISERDILVSSSRNVCITGSTSTLSPSS